MLTVSRITSGNANLKLFSINFINNLILVMKILQLTYSFISIKTIGVSSCGPRKLEAPSTIRSPSRKSAVAANDSPKISKTPAIIGGKPSFSRKPPITPNTVMKRIGFRMIDFIASTISVVLLGRA